jgi:hypothetical protein
MQVVVAMQLKINGQPQLLIPVQLFRTQMDLPPAFGVNLFEPKSWDGLGSIEGAGLEVAAVRQQVLGAIPPRMALTDLLELVTSLTYLFRQSLVAVNSRVGLRLPEIDFAEAGFHDVLHSLVYGLVRAQGCDGIDLERIYYTWLDDSVRVSSQVHGYDHASGPWQVYVINYAYGRAGLQVDTGMATHYVLDAALACPAAGFMHELYHSVARSICRALVV